MQFAAVPTADATGAILAHGVRAGEARFKKGRALSSADVATLKQAGVTSVVVARVERDDVPEDQAAARIAGGCAGKGARIGAAFTGRVNLYATADGVARIAPDSVNALNAIHESVTLATVSPFARVTKGQMLATIKIIPFAAPRSAVEHAERLTSQRGAVVELAAFTPKSVALISTFLPDTKPSLLDKNRAALAGRLQPLGSALD